MCSADHFPHFLFYLQVWRPLCQGLVLPESIASPASVSEVFWKSTNRLGKLPVLLLRLGLVKPAVPREMSGLTTIQTPRKAPSWRTSVLLILLLLGLSALSVEQLFQKTLLILEGLSLLLHQLSQTPVFISFCHLALTELAATSAGDVPRRLDSSEGSSGVLQGVDLGEDQFLAGFWGDSHSTQKLLNHLFLPLVIREMGKRNASKFD